MKCSSMSVITSLNGDSCSVINLLRWMLTEAVTFGALLGETTAEVSSKSPTESEAHSGEQPVE